MKNINQCENNVYYYISNQKLFIKMSDDNIRIVDTRPSYYYNGWLDPKTNSNGHIPNSVNFSYKWIGKNKSNSELIKEFERISLEKHNEIVLYGEKSKIVYDCLIRLGYKNVKILKEGLNSWLKLSTNLDKLVGYKALIYPKWLNSLIKGDNVETMKNSIYKLFEVSWGEGDDYKAGHIKGAVHIDTEEFEERPLWNRKSDKDIEKALIKNGIRLDSTVLLYGLDTRAVSRVAIILKYAGVKDVRILDGGFKLWVAEGYEIERKINSKISTLNFANKTRINSNYIIDKNELQRRMKYKKTKVLSIRSLEEYNKQTSGYSYIFKKGRIEGDTFGYDTDFYRNVDDTMFNYELIKKNWLNKNISKDDNLVFYCGTGWRASEIVFYSELMGWENSSLYDGGWLEWSEEMCN
ncbi:rhodanese-like domain-containing protein [Helicovermis profundi]|uniref:thiosulfate sulfurtransferase n=1 Tax=Helicovermis profundi TaxID=3065157 RepID=A0AAU9EQB5_9FIRM|nr:sulfurtransferase [Clostridia bacterium S502]